jgi:hypothetical protein
MRTATSSQQGDQRLAARVIATTRLDFREAVEAIERVCRRESDRLRRRYQVKVDRNQILVGYRASPGAVPLTAGRPRTGLLTAHWLAAIRFPHDAHGVPPRKERAIEIRLTNWVVDSDGRREHSDGYEKLVDAIRAAVSA